jgi:predicted permease
MSLLTEITGRLRALFRRRSADSGMDEEIRFHLEMEAEKYRRQGLSPEEASRRARRAFGSVSGVREDTRDARGVRWVDDLGRDLRHAARQLLRSPGFTTVAVVTLALGIGATTAVFTVVDGVVFRRLPFADPDRLVVVWETDRRSGTIREPASWPDILDFQDRADRLTTFAAFVGVDASFATGSGAPIRVAAVAVSHRYLALVGIQPLLGRSFTESDDLPSGPSVALLGEAAWREHFGSDPAVVGRTVRLDDRPVEVIGVLPAGVDFGIDQVIDRAAYHGPFSLGGEVAIWIPLQASADRYPRDTHPFHLLGRLSSGATVAQAQDELATIAAALERDHRSNLARGVFVERLTDVVLGPVRPVLYLLLGAVAMVLVIACVNVANLLLARAAARVREVTVRGALGAGFGRLLRQFLVEAALLCAVSAAVGVGLAILSLELLLTLAPASVPRLERVAIDGRVLGLTLTISVGVAFLFGLLPASNAFKLDVMTVIRGEGPGGSEPRGRKRLRQALVVAELALLVILAVGATLLIRSFVAVVRVDPGFHATSIATAAYQLPDSRYPRDFSKFPNWVELQGFTRTLLERARALPGVEAAAISASHPLDPGFTNSFTVVGREAEAADWPEISVRIVSAGYVETLGLTLRAGRSFTEGDDPSGPPVVLINDEAARRFFADRDPLGQEIRFWGSGRRIVGVVGNERIHGLDRPAPPAVYVALPQAPSQSGVLLLRAAGDPAGLAPASRAVITAIDPLLAVFRVEPLATAVVESEGERRFAMAVLGVFAGVALVMALIGIYGVLSFATAQRRREMGVRSALGASRGAVTGLVVRDGLRAAALGIALGLLGAAVAGRGLAGLLYGVGAVDPLTFAGVAGSMLAAAALATWAPARRAAAVPPIEVLRGD